jgi:KipI family sensor histidine kinase inhibitor
MGMVPTLTAYGSHAWLVRFAERADEAAFLRGRSLAAALARSLDSLGQSGLREIIPAPTTLLLDFHPQAPPRDRGTVQRLVEQAIAHPPTTEPERCVEIPVHYGGPDLERVARQAGLSPEAVIERHHQGRYRVLCLGFAPGFPYLGGLDATLATPRLATPRPRVPAGSVAIGGDHTGVYSIPSPGGWNLIGQTSTRLFDPQAADWETMFRLRAGDRVRFVPIDGPLGTEASSPSEGRSSSGSSAGSPMTTDLVTRTEPQAGQPVLRILDPGLGVSLQDTGRQGFRRFGVPSSGTVDPVTATWANRLLDNPPDAPVLELCLQGQCLEALRDGWVAVCGGSHPRGQAPYRAFRVRAGESLDFGPGDSGVWTYLAVPGGFWAEAFLESRSANPRAGIGRTLRSGDLILRNPAGDWHPPSGVAARSVAPDQWVTDRDTGPLRVWPGPQWAQFDAESQRRLFETEWRVTSQCDRVGYRLRSDRDAQSGSNRPTTPRPGPNHDRTEKVPEPPAPGGLAWTGGSLISEPVLTGSIQVPADGQPIVTLHDGPTLGGYPKIAWIDPRDLPRLVQRRSGQPVGFILAKGTG